MSTGEDLQFLIVFLLPPALASGNHKIMGLRSFLWEVLGVVRSEKVTNYHPVYLQKPRATSLNHHDTSLVCL